MAFLGIDPDRAGSRHLAGLRPSLRFEKCLDREHIGPDGGLPGSADLTQI